MFCGQWWYTGRLVLTFSIHLKVTLLTEVPALNEYELPLHGHTFKNLTCTVVLYN